MLAVKSNKSQTPDSGPQVRDIWFLVLRVLAIGSFSIYVCWNIFWLARGRMAPSMLLGFFGIPGPTTGLTRALRAAVAMKVRLSLAYHPLAIPLVLLFAFSVAIPSWQIFRGRKARLPGWAVWTWAVLLLGGWIFKLLQGPAWW